MRVWAVFGLLMGMGGCASRDSADEVDPASEPVVDGAAPPLRSWSGAEDCCGVDPHPVHGAMLSDGSVVMVGKSAASGDRIAGFATRWVPQLGPAAGRFVDTDPGVIAASVAWPPGSAMVQAVEADGAIVAVGFRIPSPGEAAVGVAVRLDPGTLAETGRVEIEGPERGTSAVLESVAVDASGRIIMGGSWGVAADAIEGLKSFGNVVDGRGIAIAVDPAAWSAAGAATTTPGALGAAVREVPEVHSIKSLRTADAAIVGVGHDDDEVSGMVWMVSDLTDHRWTRFDDDYELTDAVVVQGSDGEFAAVLVGHGGPSTIDGHAKMVRANGEVVWSASFGNPGLQPEDMPDAPLAPDDFIFDECWGVAATPSGVVIGCGSGIEGCDAVDATAKERQQCQSDPRRVWRSHVVGVSLDGAVQWSRTDAFVSEEGEAFESASEFVFTGPDGDLFSVVDHDFGVGLARYGD